MRLILIVFCVYCGVRALTLFSCGRVGFEYVPEDAGEKLP